MNKKTILPVILSAIVSVLLFNLMIEGVKYVKSGSFDSTSLLFALIGTLAGVGIILTIYFILQKRKNNNIPADDERTNRRLLSFMSIIYLISLPASVIVLAILNASGMKQISTEYMILAFAAIYFVGLFGGAIYKRL